MNTLSNPKSKCIYWVHSRYNGQLRTNKKAE